VAFSGEALSDSTGEGCSSAKAASRRSYLWMVLNEPISAHQHRDTALFSLDDRSATICLILPILLQEREGYYLA